MDDTTYALAGTDSLDRGRLQAELPTAIKLQYGVKIVWHEVDAVGRRPEKPFSIYAFDHFEQAERFATLYDPATAPAQGAAKIEFLRREGLEVYGEWQALGHPATVSFSQSERGWPHEEAKQHSLVDRLWERCAAYAGKTCPARKVPQEDWCERCLAATALVKLQLSPLP